MLHPVRIVDPVARTERVEAIRGARMLAPRQGKRVDDAVEAERHVPGARELGVQKGDVEVALWITSVASPTNFKKSST